MTASSLSEASKWMKFFEAAGIPSKISLQYSKLFADHRIQLSMLPDLTKELLNEIGITAIGDKIAILKHSKNFMAEQSEKETLASIQKKVGPNKTKKNQPPTPTVVVSEPKLTGGGKRTAPASDHSPQPPTSTFVPSSNLKVTVCSSPDVSRRGPESRKDVSTKVQDAPDGDVPYKVKMPKGTTDKTRAILEKAKNLEERKKRFRVESPAARECHRTVFARLGAAAGPEGRMAKMLVKKSVRMSSSYREGSPEVSSTTDGDEMTLESDKLPRKQSALDRLGTTLVERPRTKSQPKFTVRISGSIADRLGPAAKSDTVVINTSKVLPTKRTVGAGRMSRSGGIKDRLGLKMEEEEEEEEEEEDGDEEEERGFPSSSGVFSRLG